MLCDLQWKLDLLLWPRDQETEFPVEACWNSQTQEGQTEQIHPQTFDDPFFWQHWHDLHALVPTGQTVNKEYYVEVLREFRKRFRRKRPALFKSGQQHFYQDNAPVHNSILVTDYLTKMGIKTVPQPPYSPDLLPVTFAYFLSSRKNLEAVIMRQLKRWKRLGWIYWHAHTRGLPWGLLEVVGMVPQVHCSRRRALWRGLEFHVCTINKSAHIKKVWKLIKSTLYMYKQDLALNNQKWLIYHKTQVNLFQNLIVSWVSKSNCEKINQSFCMCLYWAWPLYVTGLHRINISLNDCLSGAHIIGLPPKYI